MGEAISDFNSLKLCSVFEEEVRVMDPRIQKLEAEQIKTDIPEFEPGDTVSVHVRVREGNKERIQVFSGTCIARKNAGLRSSFTVRKVASGVGVERVFPLSAPVVDKIEVKARGRVRRAKLYYLRGRSGKAARIKERPRR